MGKIHRRPIQQSSPVLQTSTDPHNLPVLVWVNRERRFSGEWTKGISLTDVQTINPHTITEFFQMHP